MLNKLRRILKPSTPADRSQESGFTMVETAAVLGISVFLLYSLHTTLASSLRSRQVSDKTHRVSAMATEYLERLRGIAFGRSSDGVATGAQLSELFDDDQDFGSVTLHQVKIAPDAHGHTFNIAADGLVGTWRVRVTTDLDGDGKTDAAREGRDDLLHIELYFNDQLQRDTMISADPSQTTEDTGASYVPTGI